MVPEFTDRQGQVHVAHSCWNGMAVLKMLNASCSWHMSVEWWGMYQYHLMVLLLLSNFHCMSVLQHWIVTMTNNNFQDALDNHLSQSKICYLSTWRKTRVIWKTIEASSNLACCCRKSVNICQGRSVQLIKTYLSVNLQQLNTNLQAGIGGWNNVWQSPYTYDLSPPSKSCFLLSTVYHLL